MTHFYVWFLNLRFIFDRKWLVFDVTLANKINAESALLIKTFDQPWICTSDPFPLIFFVSSQLFWDNVKALRIQFLHSRRYRLFDKSLWIYAKTQWTPAGLNVAASTFPNQTFCSKSQLITFRVPYQTESIDSDDTVCSNIM